MGWYICVKRKIQDNWYNVICMTYCLCNAFWIMVIRSAYSNRFAYLSWFIYPIVIAYPLINLPVWEDQDRKTGWILLAYVVFTAFMLTIIW
jgi:FtsH-binding integral membrane protein